MSHTVSKPSTVPVGGSTSVANNPGLQTGDTLLNREGVALGEGELKRDRKAWAAGQPETTRIRITEQQHADGEVVTIRSDRIRLVPVPEMTVEERTAAIRRIFPNF